MEFDCHLQLHSHPAVELWMPERSNDGSAVTSAPWTELWGREHSCELLIAGDGLKSPACICTVHMPRGMFTCSMCSRWFYFLTKKFNVFFTSHYFLCEVLPLQVVEHKALMKLMSDRLGPYRRKKGGVRGRGVRTGGIWGRQDSSQHSVACTSANERGKGSASNYTEIMTIIWNHGNSSHPEPLPLPHPPFAALSSYFTPPKLIFFFLKITERKINAGLFVS